MHTLSPRTSPRRRRSAVALAALVALAVPLAACSSDDDDTSTTDTEAPAADTTDDTMADDMSDDTMADDDMDDMDDTTDDTEAASGEIGTTARLGYLNEEDPEIGALFDWNTGDGVIAISYLGTQTVGLYGAGEVDEATATSACELASTYVFDLDPEAEITVYSGGYSDGVAVVTRTGESGTCAAA